jgi:hypothetical protein
MNRPPICLTTMSCRKESTGPRSGWEISNSLRLNSPINTGFFGLVTSKMSTSAASSSSVTWSAAGRAGAEAIWLPTALLPRFGVRWSAGSGNQVTADFRVRETPVKLRLRLDAAGRITSLVFDRWGDPDNTGTFAQHQFGGEFTGYAPSRA